MLADSYIRSRPFVFFCNQPGPRSLPGYRKDAHTPGPVTSELASIIHGIDVTFIFQESTARVLVAKKRKKKRKNTTSASSNLPAKIHAGDGDKNREYSNQNILRAQPPPQEIIGYLELE